MKKHHSDVSFVCQIDTSGFSEWHQMPGNGCDCDDRILIDHLTQKSCSTRVMRQEELKLLELKNLERTYRH